MHRQNRHGASPRGIYYKKKTAMKDRIYQIMQSQQMTQRDFANALSISPSSLSSIFNGRTSPTTNTVQAIHRRFPEISIKWLMFGEGEMLASSAEGTPDAPDAASGSGAPDESVRHSEPIVTSSDDGYTMEVRDIDSKQAPVVIRETVKYIDKPQRHITEIHVFYDDGTFETFSARKD